MDLIAPSNARVVAEEVKHHQCPNFEVFMDPKSSPLSIGYFSPGWPLDAFPNGVVSYVADMTIQLRAMGHQVTVVAAEVAGEEQEASVYSMQLVRPRQSLARRSVGWAGVSNRTQVGDPPHNPPHIGGSG